MKNDRRQTRKDLRRHAFLLDLLRRRQWTHFNRETTEHGGFDWRKFYDFLKAHRLREYVFSTVVNTPLWNQFPDRIAATFHHYMDYSRRRRSRLLQILAAACEILQDEEIPHLVLKGPALACRFYPASDYRHQGDVDLLVKESESQRAYQALIANGFHPKRGRTKLTNGRIRTEHAVEVRKDDLPLDLHWAIRRGPGYRLSEEEIWRNQTTCEIDSTRRPVLSDEHLIVMICLSLLHDLGRGGMRFKSVLDLSLLVDQRSGLVNSAEFWERRDAEAIALPCKHVLTVSEVVFPGRSTDTTWRRQLDHHHESELERSRRCAWRLVAEERGSVESSLWLAWVQQLWRPKNAAWWFTRHFQNYRRWPLLVFRAIDFCRRLLIRTLRAPKRPHSDESDEFGKRISITHESENRKSAA